MIQILPILLIFLSGYIFKRFHKDQSSVLIDIVFYFIFPIFIFYKVHFLEFNSEIYIVMFFAFLAFCLGVFFALILNKIFHIEGLSAGMIIMSVAYGNTSFLGFAFVDSYYGSYALSLAVFYDQINMLLLAALSPIICMMSVKKYSISFKKIFISIFIFPPTIAFILAIISKIFIMPEVLSIYLEKVSLSLVPLIMFAVGMRFKLSSLQGKELEIGIIIAISMFLIPLSLYLVSLGFFDPSMAIKVSIMEAAMPPMVMATVIAIKSGLDEELGMGALGVGTILSFVSMPLIYIFN